MTDYNPMTNPFHPLSPVNAAHQQAAVQAELITGIPQGSGTTAWMMVNQKETQTENTEYPAFVGWTFFVFIFMFIVGSIIAMGRGSI